MPLPTADSTALRGASRRALKSPGKTMVIPLRALTTEEKAQLATMLLHAAIRIEEAAQAGEVPRAP